MMGRQSGPSCVTKFQYKLWQTTCSKHEVIFSYQEAFNKTRNTVPIYPLDFLQLISVGVKCYQC